MKSTRHFIFLKSEDPRILLFCSGCFSAMVQAVFVREALAIFFQSEIVLGIALASWLVGGAAGSIAGDKHRLLVPLCAGAFGFLATAGCILLRSLPLLFQAGAVIPLYIYAISCLTSMAPVSFIAGYLFGSLIRYGGVNIALAYRYEIIGMLAGAILVYIAIISGVENGTLICGAIFFPATMLAFTWPGKRKRASVAAAFLLVAFTTLFYLVNPLSLLWKYPAKPVKIESTHQGEMAWVVSENDTTILLNRSVYKSNLDLLFAEQAVHVPAAQLDSLKTALIILDRGQERELARYSGCKVEVLEEIQQASPQKAIIGTVEQFNPGYSYDLILCGASIPLTAGTNRFFTREFFQKVHDMLSPGGLFSFTIPAVEHYSAPAQRRLFLTLEKTLLGIFGDELTFNGTEYKTFMASDRSLSPFRTIRQQTSYLASFVVPGPDRYNRSSGDKDLASASVNSAIRPVALGLALRIWMDSYQFSLYLAGVVLLIVIGIIGLSIPYSRAVFSVGSSGFCVSFYSLSIMLMYQSVYGTIYREISLLVMALSAGFLGGSFVKKIAGSDFVIGLYIIASIVLFFFLHSPPKYLFLACQFGIGFLSAAQFVTRKQGSGGILNAADLLGGIVGMALGSVVLIPQYGVVYCMGLIGAVKIVQDVVNKVVDKR